MSNKESKRDRFVRIVEMRVNKIINDLDSLGKCSNRNNYEYSEGDIKIIFNEIEKKVRDVKSMYQGTNRKKNKFKLKR